MPLLLLTTNNCSVYFYVKNKSVPLHKLKTLQHIMEQLLHYIWKHKMLPLQEMKTTRGLHVEVWTGLHKMNSGPYFFNAKIKIDDLLWVRRALYIRF